MFCKCGKKAACIDSRYDERRRETRRRYLCTGKRCGERWSTLEMVAKGYKTKRAHVGQLKVAVAEQFTKDALKEIKAEVLRAFERRTLVGYRRLRV